jgi:hypothetical protein
VNYEFRPAVSYTDRHGLFVALVGGTNSGKTFSALRLARGIAGPKGKVAVADTEGGRTLHLKRDFDFDVLMMDPPHRPQRYAEMARAAEQAGYAALVIDSFTAEWAGMGGVLSWSDEEAQRMAGGDAAKLERVKGASWIKPKAAHKAMVFSLLERRIPIIFSIRGEETFKPPNEKFFKAICNQSFLFEVTVSFRLASDRKGIIDLSDAKSWKMEGAHQALFRDGEQLSERHGEALAAWASGGAAPAAAQTPDATPETKAAGEAAAGAGVASYTVWLGKLDPEVKATVRPFHKDWSAKARAADDAKTAATPRPWTFQPESGAGGPCNGAVEFAASMEAAIPGAHDIGLLMGYNAAMLDRLDEVEPERYAAIIKASTLKGWVG